MSHTDRMTAAEIRTSASLASIYGLRMLGLFLILPVFAVHAQTLPGGNNPAMVGLALGIYGLTQGLLQIPFGAASDRWGRKPVIIGGLLLFALGSFMCAFATDLTTTIVARAVQGAGAISAAVSAFIADATRDEHRTKAMAMVGASFGLSFALSLVGAPPLYASIGVPGLFALTGVLALIAVAVVAWVVPPAPAPHVHAAAHGPKPALRDILLDPQLARLNLGIFLLNAVQMAMFVVVPLMLLERGLATPQHWWVYLPVVLVSFALMMPPIIAAERRGRLRVLTLSSVALLGAVLLGLALWAQTLAWLVVWLLLFFIAFNVLEAALPSLTSRLAPAASRGLALGVYNTTQSMGLFVGGAVGGLLAKHAGASGVFLAAAAATAVWLAAAWGMRELPRKTAAAPGGAPAAGVANRVVTNRPAP